MLVASSGTAFLLIASPKCVAVSFLTGSSIAKSERSSPSRVSSASLERNIENISGFGASYPCC